LRKDLDEWSFHVKNEDAGYALSRFLIALDELRARLAPSKYPNIEISDEGYLWFNIDTSMGTAEVLALPFGFKPIKPPSLLVSFPRKAEDINLDFLNKLRQISNSISEAKLFAGFSTNQKILAAYRQNKHPPLVCTQDFDEILEMKKRGVFFSYLGICFSVLDKSISEVEQTIRNILLKLEGKVGALPK
jgi:hypothetical protein